MPSALLSSRQSRTTRDDCHKSNCAIRLQYYTAFLLLPDLQLDIQKKNGNTMLGTRIGILGNLHYLFVKIVQCVQKTKW